MKYGIYSYRDAKAKAFMPPQCDQNDATAIRGFSYAVNNNDIMNFSPGDYELFKLGEFDVDTGIINAENVPILLKSGVSVFEDKK